MRHSLETIFKRKSIFRKAFKRKRLARKRSFRMNSRLLSETSLRWQTIRLVMRVGSKRASSKASIHLT